MSKMSTRSRGLTRVKKDGDDLIFTIYPMEPGEQDVVTIYNKDFDRIANCEYFNDSLIDLKIKDIISSLPKDKKEKVHAFSSLFYSRIKDYKSTKEAHDCVAKWTKRANIFELDFIFFPIIYNFHCSLVIICRPSQWALFKNECIHDHIQNSGGCFLHFDSCKYQSRHKTKEIYHVITNFLSHEWNSKKKTSIQDNDKNNFKGLPIIRPLCPKQENGYDCGPFLIKYVEKFLALFPETSINDISSKMKDSLKANMFNQSEVTQLRDDYRIQLAEFSIQYANLIKKQNSEEESRALKKIKK